MADALYLVDGSGFIFRAFHALPPLSVREGALAGSPTGAVYGFAQMLIKLEQDHHPSHLAVVFDKAGKTSFRDALYADYKANRSETPPDLIPQFRLVREVAAALGVPSVEVDHAEADDVIATLTRRAREAGMRVVVVSSDKDLMQLIDDEVRMVRPVWQGGPKGSMQDVLYGAAEVVARYGVSPKQLGDVLALMGDAIDNIPGVPGIGEKTAAALIQHFGSLESLLARLDEVPKVPKLRGAEKIRLALVANEAQARLSRRLVALDEHLALTVELPSLVRAEPDMQKVETNLMSMYLDQFKRGYSHTAVYLLRDRTDEGGNQTFGFYKRDYSPRKAAVYLHNLTTILADKGELKEAGKLDYAIPEEPATVHDMLLQNSDGTFQLIVWGERLQGEDAVSVKFGAHVSLKVYDPTVGTDAVQTQADIDSLKLTLSDHPLVLGIQAAAQGGEKR